MPINCRVNIGVLEPDEFKTRDYRVMGHAFACQNELGRLCEESVYETDLVARLRADGSREVYSQEPIFVTHGDFSKTYYLDLAADNALYDLKTTSSLVGEHKAQVLNYMLLLGLRCGKLINFRSSKVQGQLVVTALTPEIRRQITADMDRWYDLSAECQLLRTTMMALLSDWGAFLEVPLYQAALTHFMGGEARVVQRIALTRGDLSLGTQRMHIHAPGVGFVVTSFSGEDAIHETHLRKLLSLTPLIALQWVNLNHATIQFITITK